MKRSGSSNCSKPCANSFGRHPCADRGLGAVYACGARRSLRKSARPRPARARPSLGGNRAVGANPWLGCRRRSSKCRCRKRAGQYSEDLVANASFESGTAGWFGWGPVSLGASSDEARRVVDILERRARPPPVWRRPWGQSGDRWRGHSTAPQWTERIVSDEPPAPPRLRRHLRRPPLRA